jgi:hypothetical protein
VHYRHQAYGGDDASSIDQERTKRMVSAVPGPPGQVYGRTQAGNVCVGQLVAHVNSLAKVRHGGRRHAG